MTLFLLIDPNTEEIHRNANAFLDEIAKQIVAELPHGSDGNVIAEDKYGEFLSIGNVYTKNIILISRRLWDIQMLPTKSFISFEILTKKIAKKIRRSRLSKF